MIRVLYSALGLLVVISVVATAEPMQLESRVDRWPYMWLGQDNTGLIGGGHDSCNPDLPDVNCEFPRWSGQEYLDEFALWIGALIVEGNEETPRVSVARDGWLNPEVVEFWPVAGTSTVERSDLWRDDWCGNNIWSPDAIADHEIEVTMSDTLTDPFWLTDDPVDGPHRPLGLKITRTTYSMVWDPCASIYWIRYQLENIGSNVLKDVYLGHYFMTYAGLRNDPVGESWGDDLAGFDETNGVAYFHDNDGRRRSDSSGNDFTVPNSIGFLYLRQPEGIERTSFNWWRPNGDFSLDWGPFWSEHCDDPLGEGFWCRTLGTPMGDEHKYFLMKNGEQDYNQYHVVNQSAPPPQGTHQWATCDQDFQHDLDQYGTRGVFSFGPLGDHQGDHTYLYPGQATEIWCALVGGLNFHDSARPQASNLSVDPSLYDMTDLLANAARARNSTCTDWMDTGEQRAVATPHNFALHPVYPNPFNAIANIAFDLPVADRITLRVVDLTGRETARLTETRLSAGYHSISWNAANAASGLYLIELSGETVGRATQKAVLLK
ncbi:T9SS type A sorting domain-containing protein [candidate division KSB1 bacterium]|nr:T9SS type A sorting domain-containing protein [candidate division KSB1 bacterium]